MREIKHNTHMLTGKEIFEQGIIPGALEENIQQQGIDVRIDKVFEIRGTGTIPAEGKTMIPGTMEIVPNNGKWILNKGYYEIAYIEGCKCPDNAGVQYKTRSSLVRCGAIVHSGHFDPGFETEHAGSFLEVLNPITLEHGARVAQAMVFESNRVENTYNGQFQGDKQRKAKKA